MARYGRRFSDVLVLERGQVWSAAILRSAVGRREPGSRGFPPERTIERVKRLETLKDLRAALLLAPASVVAVECAAFPEAALLRFLMDFPGTSEPARDRDASASGSTTASAPLSSGAQQARHAVWIRLGSDGRRPVDYALDWTWAATIGSIASCDRLWRIRRRFLESLPPDPPNVETEIFQALPWKSAATAERTETTT